MNFWVKIIAGLLICITALWLAWRTPVAKLQPQTVDAPLVRAEDASSVFPKPKMEVRIFALPKIKGKTCLVRDIPYEGAEKLDSVSYEVENDPNYYASRMIYAYPTIKKAGEVRWEICNFSDNEERRKPFKVKYLVIKHVEEQEPAFTPEEEKIVIR